MSLNSLPGKIGLGVLLAVAGCRTPVPETNESDVVSSLTDPLFQIRVAIYDACLGEPRTNTITAETNVCYKKTKPDKTGTTEASSEVSSN